MALCRKCAMILSKEALQPHVCGKLPVKVVAKAKAPAKPVLKKKKVEDAKD